MRSGWIRRICLPAALIAVTALSAPAATASAPERSGNRYYLDCAGGSDSASGHGPAQAWRTLRKANSVTFTPGSRILFKRGTRCEGTFAPHGSGTAARPIATDAYGKGAKPAIAGQGALAAVLLDNVEYWEVRDLDVSNWGTTPPAADELRIGIYVRLTDFGTARHIVIADNHVHDVNGCDCASPHSPDVSGGIILKAGGTRTPTAFDDVTITGNTVRHVDRQGVMTYSDWERRARYPDGRGTTYLPMTRLRIVGNHMSDLGGDAVGVQNGKDALVARNTVRGWAERAPSYTAAMSAFNSDGTVFSHNVVTDGAGHDALPSAAFMTEHANSDTVFEYNFSANNQGGMLVVCSDAGRPSDNTVVRYNISQNDNSNGWFPDFFEEGGRDYVGVITTICLESGGVDFYGNTVYSDVAERMVANYTDNKLNFTDNIFVGRSAGAGWNDPHGVYDHNLYQNITTPPSGDSQARTGDPRLVAPGTATGLSDTRGYRLRAGSPALRAGVPVAGDGGRDFFGNPIPDTAPNIGAYTGPPVR